MYKYVQVCTSSPSVWNSPASCSLGQPSTNLYIYSVRNLNLLPYLIRVLVMTLFLRLKKFKPDREVFILPFNSARRTLNRRWDQKPKNNFSINQQNHYIFADLESKPWSLLCNGSAALSTLYPYNIYYLCFSKYTFATLIQYFSLQTPWTLQLLAILCSPLTEESDSHIPTHSFPLNLKQKLLAGHSKT